MSKTNARNEKKTYLRIALVRWWKMGRLSSKEWPFPEQGFDLPKLFVLKRHFFVDLKMRFLTFEVLAIVAVAYE